jgi:hypothetical protein
MFLGLGSTLIGSELNGRAVSAWNLGPYMAASLLVATSRGKVISPRLFRMIACDTCRIG